jgi:hypothetical protein
MTGSSMHVDPPAQARATGRPGGAHERSPTAKSPATRKKARPLGLSESTNSPQSATPAAGHSPKLRCAKSFGFGTDNDENGGAALAAPLGGDSMMSQQPFNEFLAELENVAPMYEDGAPVPTMGSALFGSTVGRAEKEGASGVSLLRDLGDLAGPMEDPGLNDGAPIKAGDEFDKEDWVGCECCLKWRRLPSHVKLDSLPEPFVCSKSFWLGADPSCDLPEDTYEEDETDGVAGASAATSIAPPAQPAKPPSPAAPSALVGTGMLAGLIHLINRRPQLDGSDDSEPVLQVAEHATGRCIKSHTA